MSNETNDRATKGPWHTALTARGHAVLANTDHGTANMVAMVLDGTTDGQPEHNARLIAAAPEMAELLERLAANCAADRYVERLTCARDARVLLAKVKGATNA